MTIPFGRWAEAAVLYVAERGFVDPTRVLKGFPHPSGAQCATPSALCSECRKHAQTTESLVSRLWRNVTSPKPHSSRRRSGKLLRRDNLALGCENIAASLQPRCSRVEPNVIGARERADFFPADRRADRQTLPAEAVRHGAVVAGRVALDMQMDAPVVVGVESPSRRDRGAARRRGCRRRAATFAARRPEAYRRTGSRAPCRCRRRATGLLGASRCRRAARASPAPRARRARTPRLEAPRALSAQIGA